MAILKLRGEFVDNTNRMQPGKPTAFTVVGFDCASLAVVSADPVTPDRWVVHHAPPGDALRRLPKSFDTPESALKHLQHWADARSVALIEPSRPAA